MLPQDGDQQLARSFHAGLGGSRVRESDRGIHGREFTDSGGDGDGFRAWGEGWEERAPKAVLALGATRWEMIRIGVLRNARAGILGAVILGLGRALGETMAVTFIIGNSFRITGSLFSPGTTISAAIASEFAESDGLHQSALIYLGLLLFVRNLSWGIELARF